MTSTDSILQLISEIHIPGFFITVDFLQIGKAIPQGISGFLKEKYDKISHGASGRKFIYQESCNYRFFIILFFIAYFSSTTRSVG